MRELDGMRILGPADGPFDAGPSTRRRTLIAASETGGRWALGEVLAEPDEGVATHLHPGEPEAIVILEGGVELHGREGVIRLGAGDVVFIPPDTEHGLRTPDGGRWLAIWPARAHDRVPGPRYGTRP
jgi:quercetin dioxygenase-like cupin family protein